MPCQFFNAWMTKKCQWLKQSLLALFTRRSGMRTLALCPFPVRAINHRSMNWILLIIAGLFEVAWAIGLKYTEGFTRLWPSVGTAAAMLVSIGLLGIAMRGLPVGTAYAVWVGVGAVGTVILGIVLFGESASPARLVSVALIVAGIIGLKLAGE